MSRSALTRHEDRSYLSMVVDACGFSDVGASAGVSRIARSRTANTIAGALCLLVLLLALSVGARPALALDTHVFSLGIGSAGVGAGQISLASNSGVAVNTTTHDVYVADTNNARVDQFSAAGVFIQAWGWGVADGLPTFETCTLTCQQGITGSGAGQFSSPTFIAVDNSTGASAGDVYVGDNSTDAVSKFSASGTYVSTIDGSSATAPVAGPFSSLAGVAVDGPGDLWVYDNNGDMFEFAQGGGFLTDWNSGRGVTSNGIDIDSAGNLYVLTAGGNVEQFTAAGVDVGSVNGDSFDPTGVAVDRSSNDVYMDSGGVLVRHYPASCDAGGNCTAADTFGTGHLAAAAGLAVDSSNGTVYAADVSGGQVSAFAAATVPDVSTSPATGLVLGSVTFNGQVTPAGGPITACHFEYVTDAAFQASGFSDLSSGGSIPCDQATPITAAGAVTATLAGLPSGRVYHVRLVAANASGSNVGADQPFTTPGPTLDDTSVADVTSSSAELGGQVNPNLLDTTYHFQYGTSTAYGQATPESASIGSDSTDHGASAHIQGLAPSTIYHFRIVVTNAAAPAGVHGSDHTFMTESALGDTATLPDNRGYELVTPAQKGDGTLVPVQVGVFPLGFQAATDGAAVAYASTTPFTGSQTASSPGTYLASRGSSGWVSQALDPRQATNKALAGGLITFGAYSPDLSKAVFTDEADSPALVAGEPLGMGRKNLFLRDNLTSSYQLMNVTPSGAVPSDAVFENASLDLSHVLFSSGAQLTPDALAGVPNLYQWSAGVVSLVGQIPVAPAVSCGDVGPRCVVPTYGADLGTAANSPPAVFNAVSADGSHIFFLPRPGLSQAEGDGQLYVREDGVRTVRYSASQKTNGTGPGGTDPNGPRPGQYWTATGDGSTVFFSSCERLTNDSTASIHSVIVNGGCRNQSSAPSGQDLYQYDTVTGTLADLTVDHSGDVNGADVQGVLGASADGSYVYFVANGVLSSGARPGNCSAEVGVGGAGDLTAQCNLYVTHAGVPRLIARLSGQDFSDWNGNYTARVTPDGAYLAFDSAASLTGFDNVPASPGECGVDSLGAQQSSCDEVYLFSAGTGQLVCASCNASGVRPTGAASIPPVLATQPGYGGPSDTFPYLPRSLSEDGSRLFFDSQDGLVPRDSNGRQDVYEYEGGRPHLISSGTSDSDSAFVDASASGDDVFFRTSASLVAQDVDQALDVYDARVGGGFPLPASRVSCAGEACRPPASGSTAALSSGSATFVGGGDLTASALTVASAKLRVLARGATGSRLTLRVRVPSRGRVRVTGSGIRPFSRSLPRAGVYRIVLGLTDAERRALKRRHRLKLAARLRFVSADGRALDTTVSISDRG